MPVDPVTGRIYAVDEQGRILPRFPAANMDPDPNFRETRSFPTGVFMPGGAINPNIIQMLAGIGAEIDPRGAGGILGRAAINYSRQQATQRANEAAFADYRDSRNQLFDILSGWGSRQGELITADGRRGVTKVERDKDGKLKITGNLTDEPQQPVDTRVGPATTRNPTNPQADAGPITQTPLAQPNVSPTGVPEQIDMPSSREGYNREAQDRVFYATPEYVPPANVPATSDVITMLGNGPSNVIGYSPDGTPITTAKFKMAPLGPKMPAEQLEAIPVPDNPMSARRQLRPGQSNVAKQPPTPGEMTIPIEKVSPGGPDVERSNVQFPPRMAPAFVTPARPRTVVVPNVSVPVAPQPVQPNLVSPPPNDAPLVGGGGITAPANVNPLLPTQRRRMQNIPDLRDLIPF